MRFQIIGFTLGILLAILGVLQLIPALVDRASDHENARMFLFSAVVCVFFGMGMILAFRCERLHLSMRETFLLTTLSWLGLCVFGAVPLYLSDLGLSFTDAFFESTSGITTTGSTVLSGLDQVSHGVLLWRSMLQWVGGIGIIAFAILLLPFLRVGGMQLFKTEASDRSDKVMSRGSSIVFSLMVVYGGITALCTILYHMFGMSGFEAINHAMTTVSTGGYSTHDASFGYFNSRILEWISIVFMVLGAVPFILFVKLFYKGRFAFFEDEQFKVFMLLLLVFTAGLSLWLWQNSAYSIGQSVTMSAFHIVSIITTTGFTTTDYTLWGALPVMFFFFLTYLGACAGSTSGGVKIIRVVVTAKAIARQIKALIYPRAVFVLRYQGKAMDYPVIMSIFGFLGLYVVANVFLTIALTLLGLDFTTAVSGAATALANVGPGVGSVIGPAGNFASLPDLAKWLLCFGMLLGRLEVLTIMVLFSRQYWTN